MHLAISGKVNYRSHRYPSLERLHCQEKIRLHKGSMAGTQFHQLQFGQDRQYLLQDPSDRYLHRETYVSVKSYNERYGFAYQYLNFGRTFTEGFEKVPASITALTCESVWFSGRAFARVERCNARRAIAVNPC